MTKANSNSQPIKTTAIIIPTFNGLELLQKNIDSWIRLLEHNDELVIVDDASDDDSVDWLKEQFNLTLVKKKQDRYGGFSLYQGKHSAQQKIKVVVNNLNLRFAANCNRAVAQSQADLLLLLNNDVIPDRDLLKQLKLHFSDPNIFAVGCLETEPNLGNVKGGKNKLWFEKGRYFNSRADNFNSGVTAWASGGSSIYDRKKWEKLEGFDCNYYPAYWEDIDLSFRAKQKGLQVMFDRKAHVIHNHESTHKEVFDQTYLDKLGWVNANYFTWKNSKLRQKLQFLLWRPYWWWQRFKIIVKRPSFWAVLAVILIAFFLRFFKLGQVPAGMTWDEAAIGYNGRAVLQTRRDEWLQFLPVSFRSFGDYKAPLAIYLNGLFTFVSGLNLWAVRLPFAVAGVLAVLGMIKLTQQLLYHFNLNLKPSNRWTMIIAGLLLAVSPWHLHFTRTGFESGLALNFIIWGMWFLLRFFKKCHVVSFYRQLKLLVPAVIMLVAAVYSYHSAKIFLPLLAVLVVVTQRNKVQSCYRSLLTGGVIALGLAAPLIKDSFFGPGLTRAGSLIFAEHASLLRMITAYGHGLLKHFSLQFLILGETDTLRHSAGAWGVLLPTTLILGFVAVIWWCSKLITRNKKPRTARLWRAVAFTLVWIVVGITPAALGTILPQANRALLALPGFIWLALLGIELIMQRASCFISAKKVLLLILSLHALFFGFYLRYYYQVFTQESADAFNEGYLEAFTLAREYELGLNNKPQVNKIIFTSDYGQPYIYALFTKRTNPIWYQGGALVKYLFLNDINVGNLQEPNALIVASQDDDLPAKEADHIIYDQAGRIRFKLYHTSDL